MNRYLKQSIFLLVCVLYVPVKVHCQSPLLDSISVYFDQYKQEAIRENGKLWGMSFDVPLLVKTPDYVVTDRPVEGFTSYKNLFYGKTDEIKVGGNSSIRWRGEDWALYSYQEERFKDKNERMELMFHEAFHRNQPRLNMKGNWTQCKHLNDYDARCLLRLEYNALLKTLAADSNARESFADALVFRAYRYALYPNACIEECLAELQEGTAEYTGIKLSGRTPGEIISLLEKENKDFNPQLFAYYSGASYCFAMDKLDSAWHDDLRGYVNFLHFAQKRLNMYLPDNLKQEVEKIRDGYGWREISKEEQATRAETMAKEKRYTKMFVNSPVVSISLGICKGFTFQPTIIYPFADGKVYNGITTQGEWGKLHSKDELYFGNEILLPTPFAVRGNMVSAKGWEMTLNEGWTIREVKKGRWEVCKKP